MPSKKHTNRRRKPTFILPQKKHPDYEERIIGGEECLTEILYPLTSDQTKELIQRRRHVRETMSTRSNRDTIYVPVVFHNVHQMDGNTPLNSYCDYNGGTSYFNFNEYTTDNNQDICNQRINLLLKY